MRVSYTRAVGIGLATLALGWIGQYATAGPTSGDPSVRVAAANPCQPANPCAARATNPCAAKNPCATRPPNPCAAKNPCAAGTKAGGKRLAFGSDFRGWTRVDTGRLSATHGNRLVNVYVDRTGIKNYQGKRYPFPAGTTIVKESFENQGGKPGAPGPVFIMQKRKAGFDTQHRNWYYATVDPADWSVQMEGSSKGDTAFCVACHQAVQRTDYVFGSPEAFKAAQAAGAVNPCAAKAANPCAAKAANPCAAKNPCATKPPNPCAAKNPCATKPPNPCAAKP